MKREGRWKVFLILSNVILEHILSDVLKLNGKLFRFTREGTYMYDIQNFF